MTISKIPNKLYENTLIARKIAEEGAVLLKNDYEILPFKTTDIVGGFGNEQNLGQIFGGSGSGWVNSTGNISYHKGLQEIASEGFIKNYFLLGDSKEDNYDKVIYYISRFSDENSDQQIGLDGHSGNKGYYLSIEEKEDLIKLIDKIGKQKIVVVLNVGTVIDTTWLLEQDVAAIVLAYYGGEQAGNALANILTGRVNPSGKTVNTWAKSYTDYLSSTTFGNDKYTDYIEDIFVGYRYFSTFDQTYEQVNYPFGFGLSYTDFEISNFKMQINHSIIIVEAQVKNIGNVPGKEVVQLYFSAPQGKLGKPGRSLIGFEKTKLLKPNEVQTIKISFDIKEMASFDDTDKIKNHAWVLEAGHYHFYLGNSIKDADERGMLGFYHQITDEVIREVTPVSTALHKRLLADGTYQILNQTVPQNKYVVPKFGSVYIQAEDYTKSSNDVMWG